MKSRFPKIFTFVYGLAFLVLYLAGMFTSAHYVWVDRLFQMRPSNVKPADPRLTLLAVDEETGKKFGFPLPRAVYARALDKMKSLGVKTVAFDVLFFDPRPGDAELAAATRRFGRVVHLFSQEVDDTGAGVNVKNLMPVPQLRGATKYFGSPDVSHLLDGDGHLRSFQLIHPGAGDPFHPDLQAVSLAASALSAYLDKPVADVLATYGTEERGVNFRLPRPWLRHEKRDEGQKNVKNPDDIETPFRRISMLDLLSGDLSADQLKALKGGLVVVGSTALGYFDHYPTPFSESSPAVEIHLNALDNELNGDAMRSSPLWQTVLAIGVAIGLTYFLLYFSPAIGAGLAAGALAAWFAAALLLFKRGLIVEFVPPALALLSAYLVLTVHRALTEGAEKKAIKGLFGQFVSPEIVDQLAQDPSKVKLGGEKRDMTVFFLDIAHFTNISEKMDPEALIQFLNRYLSSLSHVILERHGTIDKYIGDCIMAFWNAPIENKDHRADAVLAALECQGAIAELNKTLDPGLPEIPAVRIGINSGVVTVGLTGSQKKLQYTVIGDEVNLASRLEGANKFFGSKIIISESAHEGCKDRVASRTLGRVRVVGKETPIKIYEPLAEKSKLPPEWAKALPVYEKGVAAFDARRYDEAL
ncbi:MAG: adenylate/guanylate cyclase domain-containing protein, partial [Elusimicrobia bacterium]|nr:adenylate/guanylate cyclase domain-containing protein [Elusimicrobiota bacterium]